MSIVKINKSTFFATKEEGDKNVLAFIGFLVWTLLISAILLITSYLIMIFWNETFTLHIHFMDSLRIITMINMAYLAVSLIANVLTLKRVQSIVEKIE